MLPALAYLHGKPQSTGKLRSNMADFKVFEQLPFVPCGEGEHLLIHLRKTGANTVFVAKQLAKYFSVKEQLVSYAGLKDRFAVTEQWFGVHLPGLQVYDLSDLAIEGVEVLSYARHNKKLRIGALTGNRFELVLRDVTQIEQFSQRWQQLIEQGVPNYFGEQRFGIDGGNIEKAQALFTGTKVKDKKKRGIYLSAARSYIFNQIISQRIEQQHFQQLMRGDVLMLAGTQSVFVVEGAEDNIDGSVDGSTDTAVDEKLVQRLRDFDVDITAPMWGAGELMTQAEPKMFEQSIADEKPDFCQGLAKFGLKQERRRIRLSISCASITMNSDENTVQLTFFLPAGCYATTVLRELIDYQDMTARVQ